MKFSYVPLLLILCISCAATEQEQERLDGQENTATSLGKADAVDLTQRSCNITLCLTGALNQNTPSNRHFAEICSSEAVDGVVEDCTARGCSSSFDSFFQFPYLSVYPALIEALDRNGDNVIDETDEACEVRLLGFSWGGVNALSIAQHLAKDRRIPEEKRTVSKVVLLDAFQPLSENRMVVPENVARVRSFRHSTAPADDCSQGVIWGPYRGFAPICSDSQDCVDFDYSAFPDELFSTHSGTSLFGDEVGHCQVPNVAHNDVIDFLSHR